jgi:hypothetical protein
MGILSKDPSSLGIVLVVATQMVSLGIRMVSGGFKSGYLEKSIHFTLEKTHLAAFMEKFQSRMAELRFNPGNEAGQYLQGGKNFGEFGSFMHAKTSKMLTAQMVESGEGQLQVTMKLLYIDPIVADTGESSYRDAVLNYVSGQADQMITVPNPSLMALNSLVSGGAALILALLILLLGAARWWPAILTLAGTGFMVGLFAIVTILRKPKEITGKWSAIVGIILNVAASIMVAFSAMASKGASIE